MFFCLNVFSNPYYACTKRFLGSGLFRESLGRQWPMALRLRLMSWSNIKVIEVFFDNTIHYFYPDNIQMIIECNSDLWVDNIQMICSYTEAIPLETFFLDLCLIYWSLYDLLGAFIHMFLFLSSKWNYEYYDPNDSMIWTDWNHHPATVWICHVPMCRVLARRFCCLNTQIGWLRSHVGKSPISNHNLWWLNQKHVVGIGWIGKIFVGW